MDTFLTIQVGGFTRDLRVLQRRQKPAFSEEVFIYLLSKWNQPNSTQNQESVVDYRITPCIDPFGIRFLNGISNTFYLIIIQHVYSSTTHFYYFFNKNN